jgi:tRNA dimethylallyltransferase
MSLPLITLLGPTACGKTHLAVRLASALDAEIVSGDSRQVYRGMDIGTGKDLSEYCTDGKHIPFHLIDIVDAGYKYNVFEYQRDFLDVWSARTKPLILCGGTGLYIESVLRGYRLVPVPANPTLREELEKRSLEELTRLLAGYKQLHNTTDVDTVKRAVRALEIEEYYLQNPALEASFPKIDSIVFGLQLDRDIRRQRITQRLKARLDEGMVAEVEGLLQKGIPAEDLIYYGLEYKYLSLYLLGELDYEQMFHQLEIAIHQFAKRQMTWFRGMKTRGIKIHWLDALAPAQENVSKMMDLINPIG